MFFDPEQPAGFECLGETRTCQRIADEVAASGETEIVVNAGIFGTVDLLGLGAEAEPVLRAHMELPNFRGIRNSLHGVCLLEEWFRADLDPTGEIAGCGHAVREHRTRPSQHSACLGSHAAVV